MIKELRLLKRLLYDEMQFKLSAFTDGKIGGSAWQAIEAIWEDLIPLAFTVKFEVKFGVMY